MKENNTSKVQSSIVLKFKVISQKGKKIKSKKHKTFFLLLSQSE
jgi:hypothetical protein